MSHGSAQLQAASFRGASFKVTAHSVNRPKRRVQVHEYPGRDRVWSEDMGLKTSGIFGAGLMFWGSSWTPVLTWRDERFCDSMFFYAFLREWDMERRGFFSLSEHLDQISKDGDPLEVLEATVDFDYFRGWLVEGLGYGDGAKGGRPPFDPVSMFKAMILQAQHNLKKMEFMIRDRLSWMRFLDFDPGGPTPDENTIRLFRNKLTETGTLRRVMKAFDWQLHKKRLYPDVGADRRCVPCSGTEATQYRAWEKSRQGG